VPEHLRDGIIKAQNASGTASAINTPTKAKDHFVAQDYLGADKRYYEPTEQGVEKKIKERNQLDNWRKQTVDKQKSVFPFQMVPNNTASGL
jgi:putative ATPase